MMNVLISGVGGPTPLGIAKSLKKPHAIDDYRLVGIDGDQLAPGLYNKELFDETYLVPLASEENYWDEIQKIVEREEIDFAFIVPEREVLVWAKKQKTESLPCEALIPGYDVAEVFYDKFKTFEFLKESGLVAKTLRVNKEEVNEKIGSKLGFPFWVRAESGAGALGSLKIHSTEEFKDWIKFNPQIPAYTASEFLPGGNYACKLLFNNGKLIESATGERVGYLLSSAAPSGISGMCANGKLINYPELAELAERAILKIFDAFGILPHGMFTVDFKEDAKNNPKITEINIRNVSFTYAFTAGGINFAEDSIKMHFQEKSLQEKYGHFKFPEEYQFIRGVDSELFVVSPQELKS